MTDKARDDLTPLQALALVGLRLLALSALVHAGSQSFYVMAVVMSYKSDTAYFIGNAAMGVGSVAFAALLLVAGRPIAQRLAPATRIPDGAGVLTPASIVEIGSFLIGTYFLIAYAPSLATEIGRVVVRWLQTDAATRPVTNFHISGDVIVSNALIVLAALFLMIRPRTVARLFGKLRRGGVPDDQ